MPTALPPPDGRSATAGSDQATPRDAPARVLIVSNVRLYRTGMALVLARSGSIEVIGTSTQSEVAAVLQVVHADIVLLDGSTLGSDATVHAIKAVAPASKIVGFALSDLHGKAMACAEAGIAAFVGPDASARDLGLAIEQARRGEFAASPRLVSLLLGRLAELSRERPHAAASPALTRREREIVPMLERGLSNKEIARALSIEAGTIKNHVHNILEKLQLRRRGEIVGRLRHAPDGVGLEQ